MKNLLLGLLIGITFCAAVGYIMYPRISQTLHDSAYQEGVRVGADSGIIKGISQGMDQAHVAQQRREDSIAEMQRKEAERRKAAARKVHKEPAPVQNWHVIDGKIADPVVD